MMLTAERVLPAGVLPIILGAVGAALLLLILIPLAVFCILKK